MEGFEKGDGGVTEKSEKEMKVVAVFATMNRRETAVACLEALAKQGSSLVRVVVADNGSSDGTIETLEGLTGLPYILKVHRMASNRGNAGGVEEAMALAMEEKIDAIWILDDDSWPCEGALLQLIGNGIPDGVVPHPFQVDPETQKLAWPVPIKAANGNWCLVRSIEELEPGERWESRPSWTGALIKREIIERVGPVKGDLFIRGEDDEYSFRIARSGVHYQVVRGAVLNHPGPKEMREIEFFGKRFFWEPGLSGWKLYYKVRNSVWMKKRDGGVGAALVVIFLTIFATTRYEKWHWERWRAVSRGIADGMTGKLGRIKVPWAP